MREAVAQPASTRARQSAAGCALLTLCRPQVTGLPVIVDVYSDGCGPCRQVSGEGVRAAAGHLKLRLCCRGGPCGRAFVFVDSVRARAGGAHLQADGRAVQGQGCVCQGRHQRQLPNCFLAADQACFAHNSPPLEVPCPSSARRQQITAACRVAQETMTFAT